MTWNLDRGHGLCAVHRSALTINKNGKLECLNCVLDPDWPMDATYILLEEYEDE